MEYTVKVRFLHPPVRFVGFRDYGFHEQSHAYYEPVPELIGKIGYLHSSESIYDYVMGNPYTVWTECGEVAADKDNDDFEIVSFEEGNTIPKQFISGKKLFRPGVFEREARRHDEMEEICKKI